ncbi:response regulator [Hymenobacter bucti]|uniref:Response regulator n=1 Tax=Hymenobacter bucti TaxID=1844114 RepID=A0ABW4QWL9_9BACT
MIRLFLVDDHPIMRDGLRALFSREPTLQVVGEAGHGQELLERLPATPADVVLLDLHMPVLDGLATAQRLRIEFPEVKILVLSMLLNERYVGQLFDAGVRGYALKNNELSELVLGIRTVAAGRQFLCNELSLRMLNQVLAKTTEQTAEPANNPYNFSRRETEVLVLLSKGLTTSEIAKQLFTSKRTIETHRQHMLEKSQARNAAALIKLAMSQGVLS